MNVHEKTAPWRQDPAARLLLSLTFSSGLAWAAEAALGRLTRPFLASISHTMRPARNRQPEKLVHVLADADFGSPPGQCEACCSSKDHLTMPYSP